MKRLIAIIGFMALLCGAPNIAFSQSLTRLCIPTATNNCATIVDATHPLPVTGSFTPSGTQNVNISQYNGLATSPTNPVAVGFYNPTGGALLDPSLPQQIVGNVAGGAVDTGNPAKVGGIYNTTLPTYANGQRTEAQYDSRGGQFFVIKGTGSTASAQVIVPSSDGSSNATGVSTTSQNLVFNGSTWDRLRSAGSNLGALVENGPYTLGRAVADTQIKGSGGFIHTVSIAPITATPTAGLLTIYNNTAESGTVVYSEWVFATDVGHTITLDIPCGTGIYVGFDGTLANVQVTVSYR